MATVIGDFASDPSRFRHNMVFQPQPPQLSQSHSHHHHQQQQHQQHHQQSYRSSNQPWESAHTTSSAPRQEPQPTETSPSIPTPSSSVASSTPRSNYTTSAPIANQTRPSSADRQLQKQPAPPDDDSGASRFPTPPDSSSPSVSNLGGVHSQKHVGTDQPHPHSQPDPEYMDTSADATEVAVVTAPSSDPPSTAASDATVVPPFSDTTAAPAAAAGPTEQFSAASSASSKPAHSIPSPVSDSFPSHWAPSPAPNSPTRTAQTQQTTVRIRDLSHIQSLARADLVTGGNNNGGILNVDPPLSQMKYDISEMPIGDVIEMVAALLTKITTTNDLQHDALSRNATHQRQAQAAQKQQQQQDGNGEGSSKGDGVITANSNSSGNGSSPYANSVLAFHGKNVPAITILSYLSRIHKYCPTTFEVFLSLLVYFDRMTERVNDLVVRSEQEKKEAEAKAKNQGDVVMDNDGGGAQDDEMDEDLADSDDEGEAPTKHSSNNGDAGVAGSREAPRESATSTPPPPALSSTATYFVVDSYNIHRLIIAGVTCASKFFSDVFYTNSRYAKVGGLPLAELNHLELQFLLLNDFRLAVPVEDLEAYATMLVEFYARDVVAQRSRPSSD
ncbi:hypothetical protein MCOR02_005121 [Pyricularia oryzae]|uniref:PHO85 cyclin-6 n=1 Tax=Pyricularia oryzae TaxID=318829 RepID=A0A4P7MW00_PYROR|nr:hypothetical protein MCOR02_005121 [Pyricularia oryzae]KAI6321431.1 hypothetical protein MCOR34_002633 [Pyricularia oryzae]KAI6474598.1 hypothetical protein MCOR17_002036 [Pyricularia oryzae]KAI6505580.1 hypothetical protein MCOR13_004078 [Pyricularia oryzae]KAI6581023.1 hypothetical protein MCOR04_005587 [Pyricularia oryzae]